MTDDVLSDAEMGLIASCMPWWLILIWGLLAVLLGIMLVITPVTTAFTLVLFMGAYWFVGGLFTLAGLVWDRTNLGWMVFTGVISMLGGLAIMVYPFFSSILVVGMLVFLIGFWAILIGAAKLYDSYLTKNAGTGILGILSVLFGLILLIYPIAGALSLALIAGFFALIGGISSVAFALTMRKAVSPT